MTFLRLVVGLLLATAVLAFVGLVTGGFAAPGVEAPVPVHPALAAAVTCFAAGAVLPRLWFLAVGPAAAVTTYFVARSEMPQNDLVLLGVVLILFIAAAAAGLGRGVAYGLGRMARRSSRPQAPVGPPPQ